VRSDESRRLAAASLSSARTRAESMPRAWAASLQKRRGDAAGDAADVRQEEVESLSFGFRIAGRKEAAGALDEVLLILRRGARAQRRRGHRVRGR